MITPDLIPVVPAVVGAVVLAAWWLVLEVRSPD